MMPNKKPLAACLQCVLIATMWSGCQHGNPALMDGRPSISRPNAGGRGEAPSTNSLSRNQATDIKFGLARTLEKQGQLEQAALLYREIVDQNPTHGDALHRLAIARGQQGRFEESIRFFRQALEVQPENPAVLADMGYTFYLQGQWDEAERVLNQSIALQPENPRAHTHLGLVYAQMGRDEEALVQFANAGCEPAQARKNLAFVAQYQREFTEVQEYDGLASIEPSQAERLGTAVSPIKDQSREQKPARIAESTGYVSLSE